MKQYHGFTRTKRTYLLALITAFGLFIACTGYLYYLNEKRTILQQKHSELETIAKLKISQIIQWNNDRNAEAYLITQSPFFIKAVGEFLLNRNNRVLKSEIIERLRVLEKIGYKNIILSDTDGEVLLSVGSGLMHFDSFTLGIIKQSVTEQQIHFSDFHYCSLEKRVWYDIIVPVLYKQLSGKQRPVAVLTFRVDPEEFLYPFIQSWPISGKTFETVIIRKEKDSIVYLNQLRFAKDAALKLKIPLSQKDVPAVQAALGNKGIFYGNDYRGIPVLAWMDSVPGTSWSILTKVDKDEILKGLYSSAWYITFFTLFLILLLAIGTAFIYNHREKNVFKALWEMQEEFRVILYSIGEAVIITDRQGIVRNLNPVAEQLTGVKETEARGKPLDEVFLLLSEETGYKIENPVRKTLREGLVSALSNHTLLVSKSGAEIPVISSSAPIKNKDGSVDGVVLVFRDQTQEREKRKILENSRARLSEAQRLAHIGDWELELRDNKLSWSDEIFRIFEINPAEFGASYDAFLNTIHPDDREFVNNAYSASVENKTPYDLVHRLLMKDGRIKYVHEHCETFYNQKGEAIHSIGTVQDVTERIKAQQAVEAERQRFNNVLETLPAYVILLTTDYHVSFANRFFRERFGESHGRRCYEYLFERTEPCENCETYKVLKTMEPGRWEWTGPDQRNYDIYDYPFTDTDGSTLILEMGIDITEHKLAEKAVKQAEEEIRSFNAELEEKIAQRTSQLQAANKELEAFSYSVSHDLRAPLRSIDGFATLLNKKYYDTLGEEGKRYIEIVRDNVKKMGNLISDLLSFSRIGRQEIKYSEIDVTSLVNSLYCEITDVETKKKVSVTISQMPVARADAAMLKQIWTNLLSNALKFSSKKESPVIQIGSFMQDNKPVYFIRDNGVGFEMEYINKLFGVFERLHSSSEFDGTGVGLAIVKRIVEKHGGSVWAESKVNDGAAFYFTLT